jgi:hypothetical protein
MGFYSENYTLEKYFSELQEDIDKFKQATLKKYKTLESTVAIKKKENYDALWLSCFSISIREDSGWYSSRKYIRIDLDSECFNWLKENYKDLVGKIPNENYYYKIYITENMEEKIMITNQIIDEVYKRDEKMHLDNLIKLETNKELKQSIFNLLKQVGISDQYYDFPTSRSKKKDWIKYSWVNEIGGQIPTGYSQSKLTDLKKSILEKFKSTYESELKKIKLKKLEEMKAEKEKEQNKKLALLLAKYDLDLDNTWNDLLDIIIDKNKYLYLAYYLEKNRGD